VRNSRGGGINLEPVYAADVTYDTNTNKLQKVDTTSTDIDTLNVGNVVIHGSGKNYGITIGDNPDQYVMISNHDISATGAVHASIIASGTNARMENGKVVAQNGLYIGYTSEKVTQATYDNSKFAVNGENGSFKAADGKFNVSDSGAITADSLMLADSYNVKKNIEDAKDRITTVESDLNTNKADLTALQGRVNGHDTDINALKTTTQGITRVEGNGTTVEGVNFKDGAVVAAGVAANKITANEFLTVGDKDNGYVHMTKEGIAVSGRLYSSLETDAASVSVAEMASTRDNTNKISYSDTEGTKIGSNVIINEGEKNQVKITKEEGIVVGLNSSVINDDGVFAGGHDYDSAKAALNASDGSIKGANGAFKVEGATGNVTTTGDIQGNNITATGALKGASLEVTGNATVSGTLGVTGDATFSGNIKGQSLNIGTNGNEFTVDTDGAVKAADGKVEIDKSGKATFGENANNRTTIAGKLATFGENASTDYTTINGGKLDTYDLTVRNDMTVKNFKADNITSTNRITVGEAANEVYLDANGTLSLGVEANQKLVKTQLANINDTIKSGKVIEANSATIGGVEIKGGNVTTATGTIQGNTISDGAGATLTGGKITANEGKIGNVAINAAGEVTGVSSIKANTFKVDEDNYLNSNGIKAKGGEIGGAKIDATTLSIGGTKLDNAEGITTNKLKIDGMTLTDTKLDTGAATFEVNGVKFNQGQVTAHADKGFVAGTSSFKQGSLIVDANNKLETTNGLTTEKATVNGNLDVTGNATFGTTGKQTTIKGDAITTDTLRANKLILGASGAITVVVDKDGSLKAANGKFVVDKDGALKAADGAFTVAKDGKTNFKKDDNNLSSINGGNIWAKATDVDNHTSSVLQHDSKGLHVKGNKAGETSAFDFDAATGISTFTGQDSTTTTINGSAITSTKAAGNTGVLDGSNLTLTNGDNKTEMTAGGATFTKDGKTTIISGDTITTGTLNVTDIVLGGTMYDTAGKPLDGKLSIGNDGHLRAANGNFDVKDDGTFKNTVGNTTLKTDTTGASMKFDNTAADGGVKSEVAVADGKAEMAVGANAAVTTTDGKVEIKGGTQTVTTTDKGTVFENTAHKDPFVENGATNTIINGNEITTGKITTDELVITGKGNADGNGGSIAFGGNGTIKSDINDGTTDGKNTSFETTLDGVNTKVTNGTTTTENKVTAEGNSNTVKQDDTHKSEFNQGLTSIGGVVTNGEIKVAQKLDGATGLLTNEVTDANGSSKLEQSGTGLTYTDSANAGNATRIDSSDVSIGSATEPDKRINLSDLGQIDELDKEIRDNEVYKNNETAVGGINAEAAIRRGEVERLDNRISEEVTRLDGRINDVSDRVNKVGAMAAAIASLKSIGYDPQAPSEFSIGLGQYKGETGVAMGFFHYPNKNFMINVSLSTAGGETMGGIGATWRFGHKSPQKLLEEQREAQAKKELAAAEKYQAAAKLAKEAQERAEYAAKLARQAQVSADNAKAAADATQAKHFG
jgi:archaellum component FlaC